MRSRVALALGLTIVLASSAHVFAERELVDRIIAIVDRDAIMLSEAEQAKSVVFLRGGADADLAEVVERLIEARLVEREVARFSDRPIPAAQIEEQLERVRARFESRVAFERTLSDSGIGEQQLAAAMSRQISISRYLERRFRALTHVTEDEVDDFFAEEILPDLADARDPSTDERGQIRRILEERKFTDRVEEWIESLKSRSSIRRYVW